MSRDCWPEWALPRLTWALGVWLLLHAVPSHAAGSTRIDLGPLTGELVLPAGWVPGGTELAARLLARDGVQEPPQLAFRKGKGEAPQVIFATTKSIEGVTLTAAELAAGGPELASALHIAPSAVQCNAFPHPGGTFELSICETVAAGTGLIVTGKGGPTASIWVDIPLAYEGPSGVQHSWVSIYFRGPGAAMASGHEMVEALLDSLTLKPGLRAVTAGAVPSSADAEAPAAAGAPAAAPIPVPAEPAMAPRAGSAETATPATTARTKTTTVPPSTASAVDSRRLAEVLAKGLSDPGRAADLTALRGVADAYSGTVLGEVATQLAAEAAHRMALATWEQLLARGSGEVELRRLALRFLGAALRIGDPDTMQATASWLGDHRLTLVDLSLDELALVFPAGNLCGTRWRELPKMVRDLAALEGGKSDSGRRLADLFRGRGLAIADVNAIATAGSDAIWRPRGDRREAMPPVLVVDGRLGALVARDPARPKAGYDLKPFANAFEALDRLCLASR